MLYDNVYVLGEIFHHFLLANPDIQEPGADAHSTLTARFEEWLERETDLTDLTHRTTLLQLASSYEAIVEMRDTATTSMGL